MRRWRLILVLALIASPLLGLTQAEQYGVAAWKQLKFLLTTPCTDAGACDLAAGTTLNGAAIIGPADNLGDHLATQDLDLDGNSIENVNDEEIIGKITQNMNPEISGVSGGPLGAVRVYGNDSTKVFAGDGTKSGVTKTKWVDTIQKHLCLTESECYTLWLDTYAGSDSDTAALFIRVFGSGGSQDDGDEGTSAFRTAALDQYIDAVGTVSGTLSAGAGTQTVTIGSSSISLDESTSIGENKLMVFTGAQTSVDIVDVPPGVFDKNGNFDTGDPTWLENGSATGQGVWTLGSGQVTGVVAVGSCFRANDTAYTPFGGGTAYQWLRISAINAGADQITTEWIGQGVDSKTPAGYLATEGAVGTEAVVAPCGVIVRPTFTPDSDYVADSVLVSFPAAFAGYTNPAFTVPAYGPWKMNVQTSLVSQMLAGGGTISNGTGFTRALIGSGGFGHASVADLVNGRYQILASHQSQIAGSLSSLVGGAHHAFFFGHDCATEPGSCEYGLGYRYLDDPTPVSIEQAAIFLRWPTADWAEDVARPVIYPYNASTSAMTIDKTDGWGQNGDFFVRAAATQTISGNKTYTGANDFSGGSLKIPSSTTLPATCSIGQQYMDTDATSGQRHYLCESANTWQLQGDGGGGGGGGNVATDSIWDVAGDLAVGTGANTAAKLPIGSNGQILRVASGLPAWGDFDADFTSGDTSDDDDLDVAAGGTGVSTMTDGGVLVGNGTGDVQATSAGTNGQILTGQTGADPSFQTMSGDGTFSAAGVLAIAANAITLATDTVGNYVSTIADSGTSEVIVSGSGSEGAAVTLALASSITRDSELLTHTNSTSSPVNGTSGCSVGDTWLNYSSKKAYWCVTAGTPTGSVWYGLALSASP